jgi:polyhydroxyalkanoate synthesis regulator protein
MKLMKKYKNRKIYSYQDKDYVTLFQLYEHIRNGQAFKVFADGVDKGSLIDITDEVVKDVFYWWSKSATDFKVDILIGQMLGHNFVDGNKFKSNRNPGLVNTHKNTEENYA